uniref:Bifunctional inhibitor/plant lipid transfer protein/seed storage helical domain-containing protein n=1 Tax=Picea sitchensis TaxID=3332 RepID=C0PTM0_PICSI|nr:unknown [Picea sitchensis]
MELMKITVMAIAMLALLASASVVRGSIQICNVSEDDLMPCMPAVTRSNVQPPVQPVQACCTVLSTANLSCFCELGNKYPSLLRMFRIDPVLARDLPGECKLNSFPGC